MSIMPFCASAATTFEVSGWLPYWRVSSSTLDVTPHLSEMTTVHPFTLTVKSDGSIVDQGDMSTSTWQDFIAAAKKQNVRVIPTLMWSNSDQIHAILSSSKSRIALEDTIAAYVKQNGYDGIDIDFENKQAADKDYFSTFLKGLYARMGSKWVTCDIESRTPLDARYYGTDIPDDATIYANDLTQINKYCDRVNVMAYDQQGVDQQLAAEAASSSQLYAPVADPAWVEKVINLMKKSISPRKIMIGVPTYGYEYSVTAYANNQYLYDILWTFNPGYATQIEQQYGVSATRNAAGEMELTYVPTSTTTQPVSTVPVSALVASSAASLYATQYNSHLSFRLIDWPDAQSIADKVELAKELGVRGVSIFKLDGGEDPAIWTVLQGVKK